MYIGPAPAAKEASSTMTEPRTDRAPATMLPPDLYVVDSAEGAAYGLNVFGDLIAAQLAAGRPDWTDFDTEDEIEPTAELPTIARALRLIAGDDL